MADVRSLLRQQREARRIEHPFAAYSDAGKLLCTLCREQIKAESLWDSHLQGNGHKRRLQEASKASAAQAEQQQQQQQQQQLQNGGDETAGPTHKRKLDQDDQDVEMEDAAKRRKSRADISSAVSNGSDKDDGSVGKERDRNRTPPALVRRPSTNTPSHGVELKIPSRPATPHHRDGSSSSSTPGAGPVSLPRRASTLGASAVAAESAAAADIDESEWAAFEADIAAADVPYAEDAVISAPAMTAEEAAAAAARDDEDSGDISARRTKADVDREDDREEATRALEDEFEEMQELEARVRRLKEKREALRRQSESRHGQDAESASAAAVAAAVAEKPAPGDGKENLETAVEDADEDSDEDEEDDWDGFRFRTT